MSERLRELRESLRAHANDDFRELFVSGRGDEFLEGILETVEDEIAEREAPPPVLEGALAEVVTELSVALTHANAIKPQIATAVGGIIERVKQARARLEAIALRGARPATVAEALGVALDLAQEQGEVSEGLARTVALIAGPWSDGAIGWLRSATHGSAASVLPASGGSWTWSAFDTDNHLIEHGSPPTLREAMLAADAVLRAEGRILLGGLPPEVALEPATPPEETQPDATEWRARGAAEIAGDEAQPDASWLRLVSVTEGLVNTDWVYETRSDEAVTTRLDALFGWVERNGGTITTVPDGHRLMIVSSIRLEGAQGGDA